MNTALLALGGLLAGTDRRYRLRAREAAVAASRAQRPVQTAQS